MLFDRTMNLKRLPALLFVSTLLLFVSTLPGCGSAEPEDPLEIPKQAPTEPDRPDRDALQAASDRRLDEIYASRQPSDLEWPALFGPHRDGTIESPVSAVWPAGGPQQVWQVEVGTGYGSPVTAQGRVVFNHRVGDEERVQCLDALSGDLIWQHSFPSSFQTRDNEYSNGPYSTPLIDPRNRRVFNVGAQGQFMCLDFESGDVIWDRDLHAEYDVEAEMFPVGATPLLADDQLYFTLGAETREAGVICLSASSGETLWTATSHGPAYTTPILSEIHDQSFLFAVTARGLVSLDPQTGEVDWHYEHFSRAPMSFNAVSPMVDGDKVLVITGPGPGAVCLQVQPDRSYKRLWRDRRVLDCQYNTLLVDDGYVYGFTSAGQGGAEFRCVEFATGELSWRYHSVLKRGQGLVLGDSIILLGELGHLASLVRQPRLPKVIAFTEAPIMQGDCYCAPAVDGRHLYLKDEQRLVAFKLRSLE
jgi:outer membrane protein assembly factor BamB